MTRPNDEIIRGLTHGDLDAIIISGDTEILVKRAKHVGEFLRASTSQIRNAFTTVKRIQQAAEQDQMLNAIHARQLHMLIPRLNYQAGRDSKVRSFRDVIQAAIEKVGSDWERFQNFADFLEAIVAFHASRSRR